MHRGESVMPLMMTQICLGLSTFTVTVDPETTGRGNIAAARKGYSCAVVGVQLKHLMETATSPSELGSMLKLTKDVSRFERFGTLLPAVTFCIVAREVKYTNEGRGREDPVPMVTL